MVDLVLKILLLLSPLVYGVNTLMPILDINFFRIGTFALFGSALLDTPKRPRSSAVAYIMFLLLGVGIFSVFVNTFSPIVMSAMFNLFLAITCFHIIYLYSSDFKALKKWICFAALINLVVYGFNLIGISPILLNPEDVRFTGGLMGNYPRLTIYLAAISGITLSSNPLVFILSILVSLITKQFSLLAVLILVLVLKNRKLIGWGLGACLIILSTMGLLFIKDSVFASFKVRWDLAWHPVLVEYFKRPFLGYGLGIVPIRNELLANSYLQFIVGAGLLGAAWIGIVFKKFGKYLLDTDGETIALVGLLALMMVEYPLEIARLWFTIITILAMFFIRKGEKENAYSL